MAPRLDKAIGEATHAKAERSVGFRLGCDSDVPDARLEGSARDTATQKDRHERVGRAGSLQGSDAAAGARSRVAVGPDPPRARGFSGSRGLCTPHSGGNSALDRKSVV